MFFELLAPMKIWRIPQYVLALEDLLRKKYLQNFYLINKCLLKEVDYTIKKCLKEAKRLRDMSPLWEMVQEGINLKTIKWTQH